MALRQLIVVVEGTAAVGPYWQTIVSDYLDKIIRCFCGNESTGQNPSTPQVEHSLVMFNTHGPYSGFLVRRSGWTKDMDTFFQWLSAIPFAGGGFNDAAVAEGLGEALMMFSSKNENQKQNVNVQKHCILVAASNPYPLPTPVYRPRPQNLEQSENIETQPSNCLSDAETLAKSFAECAISLSVICPRKLPKLRAIYNAGKHNPGAADLPIDNVKNPHFLVLISENFMEARVALSGSGMTNLPSNQTKTETMPVPGPISGPPSASIPSANRSVLGRQAISIGKSIPPAAVKVEPTAVTTSQVVQSLQASSPISTSQGTTPNNENVQDIRPSMTTFLRPIGGTTPNVRILNDVAQVRQTLDGGTSIGLPSVGARHTVISSGSVGPTSVVGSLPIPTTCQVAQNSASASFTSTMTSNPFLGVSQSLNNLQVNVSVTLPEISQGNLTGPPMVQTGMSMNSNMMSGIGTSSMQIRPGMQPVGVSSNSLVTSVPLNQQTSSTMQSTAQSKYVKLWEGSLTLQRQGQQVFITRLEGYRSALAPEMIAANWPATMQIIRLISQDYMNNKQHVGKADFLVFRVMDQNGFLGQLQEKKLCAVIQLPTQTLLLSVSDKPYRLIGMLFPGDMVVFKPQIPNQEPQLQAQQQQQPQQPLAQIQQQKPLLQLQQQQPPPQQQMAGTNMNQAYMKGAGGSQFPQGQVSSEDAPTMP